MISVNICEAKSRLSELLVHVEKSHETVQLCRNGQPIAQIVPLEQKNINPLLQHPELSSIKFRYDPTELLSDDAWAGEK